VKESLDGVIFEDKVVLSGGISKKCAETIVTNKLGSEVCFKYKSGPSRLYHSKFKKFFVSISSNVKSNPVEYEAIFVDLGKGIVAARLNFKYSRDLVPPCFGENGTVLLAGEENAYVVNLRDQETKRHNVQNAKELLAIGTLENKIFEYYESSDLKKNDGIKVVQSYLSE